MRFIRASELSSYIFCQRSWWYQRRGLPSANQQELAGGDQFHRIHGRQVVTAGLLKIAAWALLLAAIILAVAALVYRLF
jgi:ABC-type uncharacterized transport system permease subunit